MADKTQFLSPEQLAKNREEFLQILRDNVKRDGVEDLIHYLENNDFFTAPSSTRYHGLRPDFTETMKAASVSIR